MKTSDILRYGMVGIVAPMALVCALKLGELGLAKHCVASMTGRVGAPISSASPKQDDYSSFDKNGGASKTNEMGSFDQRKAIAPGADADGLNR